MGASVFTRCKQCGEEFWAMHGGGFFFHLLHCDKCGREKSIGFDELGDIHLRYLKGLKGPYSVTSMKHDEYVREHLALEPIAEVDYHRMIEEKAGKCRCRGKYRLDAPPRCPKCRSTDLQETDQVIMFD